MAAEAKQADTIACPESFGNLPEFSPNAAAVVAAATTEASRRGHSAVGTEHVLFALLTLAAAQPRILGWLDSVFVLSATDHADWRERMVATLEGRRTFQPHPAGPADGQPPPFTTSMREVFDVVRQISSGPVRDGAEVLPDGLVATEFILAAVMVHGVNVAAECLGRASKGRLNSWTILEACNIDPARVHVKRQALLEVRTFTKPGGLKAGAVIGPAGPFVLGATGLPDVDGLPDGPTEASNWLVPGHLMIGEKPEPRDASVLMAAGVTTFLSLIGEHSFDEYQGSAKGRHRRMLYPSAVDGPAAFIHFPIQDFDVPSQEELEALVFELKRRLVEAGECLFVHCRGGHGRTGTVVVPLIAALFDVEDREAVRFVEDATSHTRASDRGWAQQGYPVEMPETNEQRALTQAVNARVRLRSRRR